MGSKGMVVTGYTTFSAVSSVSLDNCFVSTYKNYYIGVRAKKDTGSDNAYFRLRASGSDLTGANYARGGFAASGTSTINFTNTGQTYWINGPVAGADAFISLRVNAPANTAYTTALSWTCYYNGGNGATPDMNNNAFGTNVTTQFDGISFIIASGSMTGSLTVCGLVEA